MCRIRTGRKFLALLLTAIVVAGTAGVAQQRRDLSVDESRGGHTLARHVGKTDAELAERLRRERQISAASTYNDRATAEMSVGAAIGNGGRKLADWQKRTGRRPNLVLHYAEPSRRTIGRSLPRGKTTAVPCTRAIVVLRWDERADRFYVLTSYPEADR
jgi:hypothetical protein